MKSRVGSGRVGSGRVGVRGDAVRGPSGGAAVASRGPRRAPSTPLRPNGVGRRVADSPGVPTFDGSRRGCGRTGPHRGCGGSGAASARAGARPGAAASGRGAGGVRDAGAPDGAAGAGSHRGADVAASTGTRTRVVDPPCAASPEEPCAPGVAAATRSYRRASGGPQGLAGGWQNRAGRRPESACTAPGTVSPRSLVAPVRRTGPGRPPGSARHWRFLRFCGPVRALVCSGTTPDRRVSPAPRDPTRSPGRLAPPRAGRRRCPPGWRTD